MNPISAVNSILPAATVGGPAGLPATARPDTKAGSPQQFRIEKVNNQVQVSVIDGATGQVVQQISADVWLRVASMLTAADGSTFTTKG